MIEGYSVNLVVMPVFYCPDITGPSLCTLPEKESHHAVKVLRLSAGTTVQLIDGNGYIYEGEINQADPRHCSIQVNSSTKQPPREYDLHIGISPPKKRDRLEFFLEKAVEIGIDTISFLYGAHSERDKVRVDRAERKITDALKQSGNAYRPVLNSMQKLTDFLTTYDSGEYQKFLACGDPAHSQRYLSQALQPGGKILILIGPEGGFNDEEIRESISAGFEPVMLADHNLRTETAGVVGCSTVFINNKKRLAS